MKKLGFILLVIVIFSIIVYVTFIMAVIELTIGVILIVVAGLLLWWLWSKLVNKLN